MKKYIIGIVLGIVIALPLAVFAGEIRSGITVDGTVTLNSMRVFEPQAQRFVDEENGLVCWVFREYAGNGITGGISCVKK